MIVYTGQGHPVKNYDEIKANDVGMMLSSSPGYKPAKEWAANEVPMALDNGAFSCYQNGYPFMSRVFEDTLNACYKLKLKLNLIVCPDIVAGGLRSLDFSVMWASGLLVGCPNLALAVQDGMEPIHVSRVDHELFSWIFIGGTVDWKWETAQEWIDWAHKHGKRCHIGRCGTAADMISAHNMGADSCDSTSLIRNKSWHHLEEYRTSIGGSQVTLFDQEECDERPTDQVSSLRE